MEFHFSASALGQLLRKGHHGVELDPEAFGRLVTWVDLNRPYHGSWSSVRFGSADAVKLEADRAAMRELYASVKDNHELVPPLPAARPEPVMPEPQAPVANPTLELAGWPFAEARAKEIQGPDAEVWLEAGGLRLPLVRIPAGEFVMGDPHGHRDEQPASAVRIEKPFLMGKFEITNGQFRKFDPTHDSRVADALNYQFGQRPWSLNDDDQPVCRISFRDALAFCRWLSAESGRTVTLPDEARWEWAARAGTATALPFGGVDADFSGRANFADANIMRFAACTAHESYHGIRIVPNPSRYDLPFLHDPTRDDGHQLSAPPGSYPPNAFGLHDMHGNVAEWTLSRYASYPYRDDGRNDPAVAGERVARGGSWFTRPAEGTSSHRAVYQDYQPVMWVGFRIVVEE